LRMILRYEIEPLANHDRQVDIATERFLTEAIVNVGLEANAHRWPIELFRAAHDATSCRRYSASAKDIGVVQ